MKSDNDSIGKGIGTVGLWLGIGAISFSGVIDDGALLLIIVILAIIGTAAIWSKT
ncbi:hypothetical protein KAU33_15415 [Candidatus Dependentiae bacterium]|nr:hypothetical protein [Candidatus Dependentiae bacterium]